MFGQIGKLHDNQKEMFARALMLQSIASRDAE